MKTSTSERVTRIVFGLGLLAVGSFSNIFVTAMAYLMGLILLGIGFYTASTEYPEDEPEAQAKPAPAARPQAQVKVAKPKAAARKKPGKKS